MKKRKPWETRQATVVFFIKHCYSDDPQILMGPKGNGPVNGFLMAPGGRMEKTDLGYTFTGYREAFEECNLRPLGSRKVAELRVRVKKKRSKVIIHVIECTNWTGRLRKKDPAFKWLRFIPISKIPWDQVPTGEDVWMKRVLTNRKKCLVRIACGKNRHDVKNVDTRPLP